MSEANLIYIAGLVFLLMVIGLILTAVEFRYGAPRRQERREQRNSQAQAQNTTF